MKLFCLARKIIYIDYKLNHKICYQPVCGGSLIYFDFLFTY